MTTPRPWRRGTAGAVLALLTLLIGAGAQPGNAVTYPSYCGTFNPWPDPYVLILFDNSATMNRAAQCSPADFQAGACGMVCGSAQCFSPLSGDHQGSKLYEVRQALYEVLSGINDVRLGFATLNQDRLRARSKHWLYQATSAGPSLPSWGAFPAVGAQEVFGALWPCDTGSGEYDTGCYQTTPADLGNSWRVARMQRLPKGGQPFGMTVEFFVRNPLNRVYKVRYEPVAGGALGGPLQTKVSYWACGTSTCPASGNPAYSIVSWSPVGEFLDWEPESSAPSLSQPYSYFNGYGLNDADLQNTCPGGWEGNADSSADPYNNVYNLLRPTDSSDPRGPAFTSGDFIPLDWLSTHRDDILKRLAPSISIDPLATPDFHTSLYFQDAPIPGESFLRLKDENFRPMVAAGSSTLAKAVHDVRGWYMGCPSGCPADHFVDVAAQQDLDWDCRRVYLLIITDRADECSGANACADIATLNSVEGVKTYVLAAGTVAPNSFFSCLSTNGRGETYYTMTRQQMVDALNQFFAAVLTPPPVQSF